MAKYYIQSGSVSLITSANHAEQAAIWAVKRTIDEYFPVDELECHLVNDDSVDCVQMSLAGMTAQVLVSQIGDGRSEAGRFNVDSLLENWRHRTWLMGFRISRHRCRTLSQFDNGNR